MTLVRLSRAVDKGRFSDWLQKSAAASTQVPVLGVEAVNDGTGGNVTYLSKFYPRPVYHRRHIPTRDLACKQSKFQ